MLNINLKFLLIKSVVLIVILISMVISACESPSSSTPAASVNSFSYSVRVLEEGTNQYVSNGIVTIEVSGLAPLQGVTDTNGFVRIFVDTSYVNKPARVLIEANQYEPYRREIDLIKDALPDTILLKLSSPSEPTPTNAIIPIELIVEDYQSESMFYDLIVQNNSATQQILTTIGVVSSANEDFTCASASGPLISKWHYIVRFHVSEPETIQKMDPPLTIQPNDVVRFTVSIVPNAIGACSSWSSTISLFVENASGVRIQTSPQTIDSEVLRTLRDVEYSFEELVDIARNSPDTVSRTRAIDRLSGNDIFSFPAETSPFDSLSNEQLDLLYTLFLEAVEDDSPSVRRAGISALASLGNTQAVPKIVLILQNEKDKYVRAEAAQALGTLKDPLAVEPLGFALQNDPANDVQFNAAQALGMIGDPRAVSYLIDSWNNEDTPSNVASVIATFLISLQSPEAVPRLIRELQNGGETLSRSDLVREILTGEASYSSAFIPTLIGLLSNDSNEYFRETVAFYFRFVPDNTEVVLALGQTATNDAAFKVRLAAIESLSYIGTSPAIEQLKIIAASQNGEIKNAAENALKVLGYW